MLSLAIPLAGVFGALAALHVYWGLGGTRGGRAAIPTKPDGEPLFRPGPLGCFVVAGGLGAFAALCLAHANVLPAPEPPPSTRWLLRGVAAIFALRTVGDFRCG